ncbi:DUF488 domain-containing protein [Alteribacillus bidgolensis]|uniref:Uncharacterized conserved protein YeaO, DUF488 family n=1 Tax=Alteribacillus bidgolensis TaxID=930129 RepID=A0A1G8F155_9BACI|nr:DUF488 domain-containing protein [Alteribacillus bidgolensis]SDH75866.1 Uncharacterized conserved protein YeaO, DUF488 family [Alteribacillus bidgolensis]
MTIKIKRIYENKADDDGKRVFVDRIWPRGVSKSQAALDEWIKDVAPSTELRKWFNHKEEKFKLFAEKYKKELQSNKKRKEAYDELVHQASSKKVTLLYAAKNEKYNHAVLLKDWIKEDISNIGMKT